MDAGSQLITSSISTHILAIFILVIIIGFNFYTVVKEKNFMVMSNRLKKITPVFHSMNFIIAYLGAILAAFTHNINSMVILMIPVTLFLMITEIKRYKKMSVVKLKDIEAQKEFKIFAKKIYTSQIFSIVSLYILVILFK